MVPKGWKPVRLKQISETVTSGSRDWAQYYSETGSKFIRMTNLSRDGIHLKLGDLKYVNVESSASDGKRTSLKEGDLLISITAELGKIGWIPPEFGEAYINQHTALVRIKKQQADSKYVAYLLSSHEMNHKINRLNDSGAKAGLNLPTIRSIPLILPPLPEQQRLAKILSTWDNAISTTEKLIANSKQQRKALMQQLLTGKKRLVNPETGKMFEGGWEEVTLGQLGQTFTGLTGKTKNDFGDGAKYVPYINIFKYSAVKVDCLERVKIYENEKQNTVKYGDIFFTTSSETPEEVGMSSVMLTEIDEPVYLNSFCFGFRPNNLERTLPEFMQYLLRSNKVRKSICVLAQGATRYNLSKVQLLKIRFDIPNTLEQKQIASALMVTDKEVELLETKLTHFKHEKKALMQQLLTGKRRVKVAA
ncbi:restriction endonuclease subunit S [Vibrio alginolyticus]|nr:restriction endonuclease subunit S [Vibrio alginolyticus]